MQDDNKVRDFHDRPRDSNTQYFGPDYAIEQRLPGVTLSEGLILDLNAVLENSYEAKGKVAYNRDNPDGPGTVIDPVYRARYQQQRNDLIAAGLLAMLEDETLRDIWISKLSAYRIYSRDATAHNNDVNPA